MSREVTLHRAAGDILFFAPQGMPNLAGSVTLTAGVIDAFDILSITHIFLGTIRGPVRIAFNGDPRVIR